MRENVLRAIHFGHAGRDVMLREASDVWWPRIHAEIVEKAKNYAVCQKAGRNFKYIKSQKECGKTPEAKNPKRQIFARFGRTISKSLQTKNYLLVSVDNNSGWPDAMILPNQSADRAVKFLLGYIATNGIPKGIRLDPGQFLRERNFNNFAKKDLFSI